MHVVVLAELSSLQTVLCGISLLERALRSLEHCGLHRATLLCSDVEAVRRHLAGPPRFRPNVAVAYLSRPAGPAQAAHLEALGEAGAAPGPLLLLPAAAVYDRRLLKILAQESAPAALVDSGPPASLLPLLSGAARCTKGLICGPAVVDWEWIARDPGPLPVRIRDDLESGVLRAIDAAAIPSDSPELRRDFRPFWFPAPLPEQARTAKRLLVASAQKGSLDLPALAHAPVENFLVSRLCETRLTPNQLTGISNVAAWCVTALFAGGQFVAGAAGALAVGILDGLDGKQARVKLEMTRGGELEHWFDALFEASWWVALAWSLRASGLLPGAFLWLLLLYVSEGIDGLAKLAVKRRFGRSIDEMGPLHRLVRLVGGRRNVYVWIFTGAVLAGAPAAGFVTLASWEAATALAHLPLALWCLRAGPPPPLRRAPSSPRT